MTQPLLVARQLLVTSLQDSRDLLHRLDETPEPDSVRPGPGRPGRLAGTGFSLGPGEGPVREPRTRIVPVRRAGVARVFAGTVRTCVTAVMRK